MPIAPTASPPITGRSQSGMEMLRATQSVPISENWKITATAAQVRPSRAKAGISSREVIW